MTKFEINADPFIPTKVGWMRNPEEQTNQKSSCKILFPLFFLLSVEEFLLNQKLLLPKRWNMEHLLTREYPIGP